MKYYAIMKDRHRVLTEDIKNRIFLFTAITGARIFSIEKARGCGTGIISKASLIKQLGLKEEVILNPDPKKDRWEECAIKTRDLQG